MPAQSLAILEIAKELQIQCNPIAIDLNQHIRTRLRLDYKSAKDCKATEETAPKSMVLHNPRPDQSNPHGNHDANHVAIAMQSTISDCNRQNQIGLQQDCQVIEGLHQNLGKSPNCQKTSPIAPESASFRNRSGIHRICCKSSDFHTDFASILPTYHSKLITQTTRSYRNPVTLPHPREKK